jgi:hypothetical protein
LPPGAAFDDWKLGASLEVGAWNLALPGRVIPSKIAKNNRFEYADFRVERGSVPNDGTPVRFLNGLQK